MNDSYNSETIIIMIEAHICKVYKNINITITILELL